MNSTIATIVTGGHQRVRYADHGGAGPPVVLLHAYLMDIEMFEPQVGALGDSFRLIAVDQRGHGGTPGDEPFDYWDVARDVLAVLDHLGIERAAVVGTSIGGFVALRVALLAPERVQALVLLGTSAEAETPEMIEGYRQAREAWLEHGPVESLLASAASAAMGAHVDNTRWKAKWRTMRVEKTENSFNALIDRDDVVGRLAAITVPTLVLHGEEDAGIPVPHGRKIAEGVPGSGALVVIAGGAHYLTLTDPDAVNPRLRAFLTAHS